MFRTDEKLERTKFYKILPEITDFSFLPVTDTDNETGNFFILFPMLSWFAYRTGMCFSVENYQVSLMGKLGLQVFLRHLPDPLMEYPRDIILMIHLGLDNISPSLII
jgi:hypothetical protein